MKTDTASSSDPKVVCDFFADFFESVYRDDDPENSNSMTTNVNSAPCLTIEWDILLKSLESIDTSLGSGSDDISPLLLKCCAGGLIHPLHMIYKHSLATNVFPNRWKTSYIKPTHKSGFRNMIMSYRGIAILPNFGKLFESIVCTLISDQWTPLISQSQHGFIKGRSTSTNLLEFTNRIINTIESGSQLDVIYADFQKAFDRVSHNVLIKKLGALGMDNSLVT